MRSECTHRRSQLIYYSIHKMDRHTAAQCCSSSSSEDSEEGRKENYVQCTRTVHNLVSYGKEGIGSPLPCPALPGPALHPRPLGAATAVAAVCWLLFITLRLRTLCCCCCCSCLDSPPPPPPPCLKVPSLLFFFHLLLLFSSSD